MSTDITTLLKAHADSIREIFHSECDTGAHAVFISQTNEGKLEVTAVVLALDTNAIPEALRQLADTIRAKESHKALLGMLFTVEAWRSTQTDVLRGVKQPSTDPNREEIFMCTIECPVGICVGSAQIGLAVPGLSERVGNIEWLPDTTEVAGEKVRMLRWTKFEVENAMKGWA